MPYKLEHRIGVPTNSKAIWDVLSDLSRWSEWNTVYPEVTGLLRIQQRLTLKQVFPGGEPTVIKPMVVDWVPNEQIIWMHSEAAGLVKRIRYIEIERLNDEDANCILSNGEIWDGLLGPRIAKPRRHQLRRGYEQLNNDIVARLRAVQAGQAIAQGDRG
jgi:hypothetical protein